MRRGRIRSRGIGSLAVSLALIPAGWPHHLALGVSDPPGGAHALAARSHIDMRYQYLAGGVNTGKGWATWNPAGSFVSLYVRESLASRLTPVFTYYQLLQSSPSAGGSEASRDLSNLRNQPTMRAYWDDYSLMLRRIAASAGPHRVIVHVEPDLWGYLEQARATALARAFAHRLLALRDRLAPRVLLAYHLSPWGTGEDPTYSKPSMAHMDTLAATSAAFYRALHARFDLVFSDVTDRDAGFYTHIEGNPRTWWSGGDFARENHYLAGFTRRTGTRVVLWQLPLGNTELPDTWGRYRDNRLQWWLLHPQGAHLRATRAAGVIGLLFGGGADGTTSEETDGGLFFRLARAYERSPREL